MIWWKVSVLWDLYPECEVSAHSEMKYTKVRAYGIFYIGLWYTGGESMASNIPLHVCGAWAWVKEFIKEFIIDVSPSTSITPC